jgi:hypothetical protein
MARVELSKQDILQILRTMPNYRNAGRVAEDCSKLLRDRKSLNLKTGRQGVVLGI